MAQEQPTGREFRVNRAPAERGSIEDYRRVIEALLDTVERLNKRIEYLEDEAAGRGVTFPDPNP